MTPLSLKLRYTGRAQRPASAWLVPGATVAEWLREAVAWGTPLDGLRILPLPDAGDPTRGAGALLIPQTAPLDVGPLCRAYGVALPGLYVPIEANVDPPATLQEWTVLQPAAETLLVWSPVAGLVRFDPAEVRSVLDCLRAAPARAADWSLACDAPVLPRRLLAVDPAEALLDAEEVLAQWQEQFGQSQPLAKLPAPADERPLTWLERLAVWVHPLVKAWQRWVRRPTRGADQPAVGGAPREDLWPLLQVALWGLCLACLMLLPALTFGALIVLVCVWLLVKLMAAQLFGLAREIFESPEQPTRGARQQVPTTGTGKPSWWARFWKGSGLATVAEKFRWPDVDQLQREREIQRLLQMLDHDPDQGLRYALPLAGDPGRGMAAPTNSLVARDLRFSLTGSSGAADAWQLSVEHQVALNRRYRELAERELERGRHERAAYVYSRLLGDWDAAANTLVDGRYYNEAAVIYQERLNNPTEAARCYEKAGRFETAVELYQRHEMWIPAGDLYHKLGKTTEARAQYVTAATTMERKGDAAGAADVLEKKLDDVDGALRILKGTWPGHPRAIALLGTWFSTAARHQRHAEATGRLSALSQQAEKPKDAANLLTGIAQVRQTYPEAGVQRAATESTLQVVSRLLEQHPDAQTAGQLTPFVAALTPQDRLLARDGARYAERLPQHAAEPPSPSQRKASDSGVPPLREGLRVSLNGMPDGDQIIATARGWAVPIHQEDGTEVLVFVNWAGETLVARCERCGRGLKAEEVLAIHETQREVWLTSDQGDSHACNWPGDTEAWRMCRPTWLPAEILAIQVLPTGATAVLWLDAMRAAWFTMCSTEGVGLRSVRIAEGLELVGLAPATAGTCRGWFSLADDNRLTTVVLAADGTLLGECFEPSGVRVWQRGDFAALAVRMALFPSTAGFLVETKEAVTVVLFEGKPVVCRYFELPGPWTAPKAAFLPQGLLAVADDERLAVYNLQSEKLVAESEMSGSMPLAIAPTGQPGAFSVVRQYGTVEFWSL